MGVVYRRVTPETDTPEGRALLEQLLGLSLAWAEEGCCPSYTANDAGEFLGKQVFAALEGGTVVGYALGHGKTLTEATSYNRVGERAFELDELYVRQDRRALGIGAALFRFVEAQVGPQVELIGVTAASDRWLELLRFYIETLGMRFNHALLVKRTDRPTPETERDTHGA